MLEDVIKSEAKTKIFRAYLQAFEPSGIKNLDFCLAVDEFRTNFFNPTYDSLAEAEKIYSKYLRPLNPGERGRSSHIDLYKSVPVSIDFNSLSENSFDQYQKLVVTRASNSCFRRFKEHAQANEESISKANPGIVAGLNSEDWDKRSDKPPGRDELGFMTWSLVHMISIYFPEEPNIQEKTAVRSFWESLSILYPCLECADALKAALQSEKLDCSSRDGLILWTARIHNRVNKILGKSEFPEDIEAIKKRWKVGWRDAAPQRLVDSNTYVTNIKF